MIYEMKFMNWVWYGLCLFGQSLMFLYLNNELMISCYESKLAPFKIEILQLILRVQCLATDMHDDFLRVKPIRV